MHMKKVIVPSIILVLIVGFLSGCFEDENDPPIPNLDASSTFVNVNEEVVFSANESVDKDGKIIDYYWNFGDGTSAKGKYVSHHYEDGGDYNITLIITDNDNSQAIEYITIHVNELPFPVINMTLPVYIHETVNFTANESYDLDGFIVDYYWDFGDGTNDTGVNVSHVYKFKGPFEIILIVTDNADAKAATPGGFDVIYRTWQVKWSFSSVVINNYTGEVEEGNSEHFPVNITLHNITQLVFNLTWDDDIPIIGDPNDEFILNVTSPYEEEYEKGPDTSEEITIYAPKYDHLNPLPPEVIQEAESPEILKGYLAENHTSSRGMGDWLVNITLTEAGGIINGFTDDSNDWDLQVACIYYIPVITKL